MILQRFRSWGRTEGEAGWLRCAGFTRWNTRRAILDFLRHGLWAGEHVLVLTTGTYRFQMGYLAITNRRVVAGMSWPFLPFAKKHFGIPLSLVRTARREHNLWGARLEVDSTRGKLSFGDLSEEEAERLAALVVAVARRAIARQRRSSAGATLVP